MELAITLGGERSPTGADENALRPRDCIVQAPHVVVRWACAEPRAPMRNSAARSLGVT
jgi:hypothetical protein